VSRLGLSNDDRAVFQQTDTIATIEDMSKIVRDENHSNSPFTHRMRSKIIALSAYPYRGSGSSSSRALAFANASDSPQSLVVIAGS
jgi:hypothetical protein